MSTGSTSDPAIGSASEGTEIGSVILLGGGTKKRQEKDIRAAQAYWADYNRRKKTGD
jgi:hypothetical protein